VEQFGVKLSLPFIRGKISENYSQGHPVEIQPEKMLSKEESEYYYNIKMMIFHCSWLGEFLFGKLREINDSYYHSKQYEKLIEAFLNKENEQRDCKINYEKLDFMGHKKLLNELLKEQERAGKKLAFDRKYFSTLFHDIISQRNNFTHGELFLLETTDGLQTILEHYKGTDIIDKNTLNSFNESFEELLDCLIKIKEVKINEKTS